MNANVKTLFEEHLELPENDDKTIFKSIANVRDIANRTIESEKDKRIEWYEVKESLLQKEKKAVKDTAVKFIQSMENTIQAIVMIVHKDRLKVIGDKVEIASKPLSDRQVGPGLYICKTSKFSDQPSAMSIGSGFFVAKNVVATAAHVALSDFSGTSIKDLRFVSGVLKQKDADFNDSIIVSKNQVFKPIQMSLKPEQYYMSNLGADWALLKVKPAYGGVRNRAIVPLKLDTRSVTLNQDLYSVGHGLGLPMKVSYEGQIIQNDLSKPYFECNLSILGGNSGSPILDVTSHKVVGIYIRGTKKLNKVKNCLVVKNDDEYGEGQECQRILPVWEALQNLK